MKLKVHGFTVAGLAAASLALGSPATSVAQSGNAQPAGASVNARSQPNFDEVRKVIQQTLEEAKTRSIAVAVVQDGEII